ncbi:MAG: response regulator transcription factor [Candidatus Obscuribacter sp.]|nr:response regulator transcription factor [Candidatus Obscuribacter sp.]
MAQSNKRFTKLFQSSPAMAKALLVEDDPDISQIAEAAVQAIGIICDQANSFETSKSMIETYPYELLILDLNLPDGNGINLCTLFQKYNPRAPILVLSADDQVETKINLFNTGAQDYLTKPFNLEELQARVRSLLRRFEPPSEMENGLNMGSLTLFSRRQIASVGQVELTLTKKEFQVLQLLVSQRHRDLSRDEILAVCWGESTDSKAASLQVILSKIRGILSRQVPDLKLTSVSRGLYRLTNSPEEQKQEDLR